MSGRSLLSNAICKDAISKFTPTLYRSQPCAFHPTALSRRLLQTPQFPSLGTATTRLRLYSTPSRPNSKPESAESLYSREILPSSANAASSSSTTTSTGSKQQPPPLPKISALTNELMNKPLEISSRPPMERMPPPRLGSNAGRSVAVRNGDIQQALLRLQRLVAENKVKSDAHRQKFHERKGLKRKRLRSERFRRRFKEGFKKMVGVVLDMRRQGL